METYKTLLPKTISYLHFVKSNNDTHLILEKGGDLPSNGIGERLIIIYKFIKGGENNAV